MFAHGYRGGDEPHTHLSVWSEDVYCPNYLAHQHLLLPVSETGLVQAPLLGRSTASRKQIPSGLGGMTQEPPDPPKP